MKMELGYYMNLPYVVELVKLSESDGGGFMATIPQLGEKAFVGDGDTVEEALESLESIKRNLFEEYLQKDISIPEPEAHNSYSGRILLRIPRNLHRYLATEANKNNASLNQYLCFLLSSNAMAARNNRAIDVIRSDIAALKKTVKKIEYRTDISECL